MRGHVTKQSDENKRSTVVMVILLVVDDLVSTGGCLPEHILTM